MNGAAFAPTQDEVAWAEEVRVTQSSDGGTGVARPADGSTVDAAKARPAAAILARGEE